MKFTITHPNETSAQLHITAEQHELDKYKKQVLGRMQQQVKMAGFRKGTAPLELVEKQIDQNAYQQEFLDEALSSLYSAAARSEKLRPVQSPQVTILKFVPFTSLEFEATVPVIGKITLPDYKKIKVAKKESKVTAADVDEVIQNLRTRASVKNDVTRAAKDSDQVWIDFEGFDQKGKAIERADGKDYPLVLGSGTFIPGFEPELVGKKAGDTTEFTLTFPKNYGVKTMQGQKVTFKVKVNKVQEVALPKLDDAFATTLGPFKTLDQLKTDIKTQLALDKDNEVRRDHEAATLQAIVAKTKVALPQEIIDEQIQMLVSEVRQNAVQRGQTYEELLKAEGKTEDQYKKDVLEQEAIDRVQAGLVLSEIATIEKITVEASELDERLNALKAQYRDEKMRAELDNPDNQREIAQRILTEKTIKFLTK
ncbi:trigger factor [bacterium]|nr:trigger factor [bacterium]NBX98398.1 trigger factor [bacterium]NDC93698.1 trigger factor [bacterium]NDD82839.1 trigger factor [bacterium]NDG28634.1 trigger factor [bacterium]